MITNTYDFHGGVEIDQKKLNRWIKDAVKTLRENALLHYTYIRSGRAMVIAFKREDGRISVFVNSVGYKEITVDNPPSH